MLIYNLSEQYFLFLLQYQDKLVFNQIGTITGSPQALRGSQL